MRSFVAAFSLLFPIWAAGQSAPEMLSEKHINARPLFIVKPGIPADVTAESYPAEIRVTGTVTREGILSAPVIHNAEGKEALALAVKGVIEHWRFAPAITRDCKTRDSAGEVVIWFEIKEGKPAIFVSNPVPVKQLTGANFPKIKLRTYEVMPKRVEFPYRAARAGVEGATEIVIEVDPQGEILARNVVYSLPVKDFGEEALAALKRARFTKDDSPELGNKNICIVQLWNFCLPTSASYPIWGCSDTKRPRTPALQFSTGSRLPQ